MHTPAPLPQPDEPAAQSEPDLPDLRLRFTRLARALLAGNPFLIASAALLLYGISRVSHDARLDAAEEQQLVFNFSSLLSYEALLVVAAIGLARRRIWYDATLMVGLQNLLVFVPFILIGQAALIGDQFAWATCLTAFGCALVNGGALKLFFRELNFPSRLLACGLVFLLLNLSMPLYYREIIENDALAWKALSPWMWFAVLPGLLALGNLLPRQTGGPLLPQGKWLPPGMLLLWAAASAAHLRAVDYVDNITFALPLVAPLVWTLAWTLWNRREIFLASDRAGARALLVHLPQAATLLAPPRLDVFFTLNLLNALLYGALLLRSRSDRTLARLLAVSAMAALATVPAPAMTWLWPGFDRVEWLFASFGVLLVLSALLKRHPAVGLLGSVALGFALADWLPSGSLRLDTAWQGALVFALIHSLRWEDEKHSGATGLRVLLALGWMGHALELAWGSGSSAMWLAQGAAGLLLIAVAVKWLLANSWRPWLVPLAGFTIFVQPPLRVMGALLRDVPPGYAEIAGAFLLLALGIMLALAKPRWLKSPEQ